MNNIPGGRFYRNLGFYLLFLIIIISLATSLMQREAPPQVLTYSQFLDAVQRGAVRRVVITDRSISGQMYDG
ncbi:MAG: ATP-dependent metallopeptidase FtsH/Yme1/Tma family protein, partial [Atribacterota bacterium]